ncbi:MAG: cyclopropane-fatty-acyl-phospholipid synthase, partial [Candidatus Azotimanducaceae bacterium]
MDMMNAVVNAVEKGWVPDLLVRKGAAHLSKGRLEADHSAASDKVLEGLRTGPIATHTDEANDQHYELPAAFFEKCLGPRLKYSCAYFDSPQVTLGDAEEAMLKQYFEGAGLANGQRILELGCGWGSLSLWMAEEMPQSEIVVVSNSNSQRQYIQAQAEQAGLTNLIVITANMVDFDPADHEQAAQFDRVISIEMFEHMNNYAELLRRVSTWLKPDGALFVHIFCHRHLFYKYVAEGSSNWMAKYFFTGGTMPSFDLFEHFNEHLKVVEKSWLSGQHYERTANAWLDNMDAAKAELMPVFEQTYGEDHKKWWQRWRMFHI